MAPYKERRDCRVCHATRFEPVLDLGSLHVSAFPLPTEADAPKAPLDVVRCAACGLVQLRHTTDPDIMYRGDYWYRSGTNQTMRDALADITRSAEAKVKLHKGDVVVDVGSNDSTLLKSYRTPGLQRVGFEPSHIGAEAAKAEPSIEVVNDYFKAGARPGLEGKAKVLTSVAMFYDLDDPHAFVEDVKRMLAPDGLWVLQLAYLQGMLERNAFDGICHEHLCYYSLATLEHLLQQHGLHAVDAQPIDLNEGTLRLYVRKQAGLESEGLRAMRTQEKALGLATAKPYEAFRRTVEGLKQRTTSYLRGVVAQGGKVHAYGASTKGNTLLQYYGLDHKVISAAWERQPQKWGRRTVGTHIPIIAEEEGRKAKPDVLFVLPWHFQKEFVQREEAYRKAGGRMAFPLPEFALWDAHGPQAG